MADDRLRRRALGTIGRVYVGFAIAGGVSILADLVAPQRDLAGWLLLGSAACVMAILALAALLNPRGGSYD